MFHFISGLPRSGSTLLASLLSQNPLCTASISSPVGRLVTDMVTALGPDNEASQFISDAARGRVLKSVFEAFYAADFEGGREVVFDNNRRWTASAAMLATLFPTSKIICCVRDPAAIVDSFERLFRANSLQPSVIYGGMANQTVFQRTNLILGENAVLGFALNGLRDMWYGPHRKNMLIVEYDFLAQHPDKVMIQLHNALSLPPFAYRFDDIKQIPGAAEFDRELGTPGLHDLKPTIVYEKRQSLLPPDLFHVLPKPFWRVKETATTPG